MKSRPAIDFSRKVTKERIALRRALKANRGIKIISELLYQAYPHNIIDDQIFHLACMHNGHVDVMELLIDNGGDVNSKDSAGETPLHMAAKFNPNAGILQVLLTRGARLGAFNNNYESAGDYIETYVMP